MASYNVDFKTADELLRLANLHPYWEIRDPQNVLLISKKPEDGEVVFVQNQAHYNPNGIDFGQALSEMIQKTSEIYPVLIIKLGMGKMIKSSHKVFHLALKEDVDQNEYAAAYYGQPNQGQNLNGAGYPYNMYQGRNQAQAVPPQQSFAELLAGVEAKMQANQERLIADLELRYAREEIKREREILQKEREKFDEYKDEIKDKLEDKTPNYQKLGEKTIENIPAILNGVKSWVDFFKAVPATTALAGATTTETVVEPPRPKKEKTSSFSFNKSESSADSSAEEVKHEPSLTMEQRDVLEKMKQAMLNGTIAASEAMDFVENPSDFFEPETEGLEVADEIVIDKPKKSKKADLVVVT